MNEYIIMNQKINNEAKKQMKNTLGEIQTKREKNNLSLIVGLENIKSKHERKKDMNISGIFFLKIMK